VQDVEELALIFVNALDVQIEYRIGIDDMPALVFDFLSTFFSN